MLVAVNGGAALLLLAMKDPDSTTKLLVAAALTVNLVLLIGQRALLTRSARLGAGASLVGYAGTAVSWLALAFGCGIEYYNARCDAVVTPLITVFVLVSVVGLQAGRLCGAFSKDDT